MRWLHLRIGKKCRAVTFPCYFMGSTESKCVRVNLPHTSIQVLRADVQNVKKVPGFAFWPPLGLVNVVKYEYAEKKARNVHGKLLGFKM